MHTEAAGIPAVDDDGFVASLLLNPQDLTNDINHPSTFLRSSILWPGSELEVVHHSRHERALHTQQGEGERKKARV